MRQIRKIWAEVLTCLCVGITAVGFVACEGGKSTNLPSSYTENSTDSSRKNGEDKTPENKVYSKGLEYTLNEDGKSYVVTGVGTCVDMDVLIAPTYNNLPITAIGEEAFLNCATLRSVEIPEGVTIIGTYAFGECSNLTSIKLSDELVTIGDVAFAGTGLTGIELPNSLTAIGQSVFEECTALANIKIPDNVITIGESAFWCCSSLTTIEVGESNQSYQSIDGNLYTKDGKTLIQYAIGKGETSFKIPSDVTKIGVGAFACSTTLTSIEIPNGMTEIGVWAFRGCASLTNVTIPMGVTTIGKSAFEGCISLTEVSIPKSVTRIEESAFRGCASLTNIEIPNHVTMIGTWAFRGCSSLESVEMPEKMESIGIYIFSECTALKSVVLSKIGEGFFYYDAFDKCVALENVYLRDDSMKEETLENYLGHDVNFYYYSEEEIGAWWHYDVDDNIVDYTMS